MKIGDLVKWYSAGDTAPVAAEQHGGIIVDGPRNADDDWLETSYAVHWFVAQETMWHNDYNLELLSESR